MKRVMAVATVFLMLAAVAVAKPQPESEDTETTAEEVVEREVPQYGGTLTICHYSPSGWDMATGMSSLVARYGSYFAEGFLMGDYNKGPSGTGENPYTDQNDIPSEYFAVGCLADAWDIPDPLTYQFHLRPGIRWQNKQPVWGREVTVTDVVNEFQRILDLHYGGTYSDVVSVAGEDTDGDGIDDSVVIKTSSPRGFWGTEFGWASFFRFQPPESVEAGLDDWKNCAGTGPFILTDHVIGTAVTYERNPDYWGRYTYDGTEYQIPFIDKVIKVEIPEITTQLAALRTGQLDRLGEGLTPKDRQSLVVTNPEMKYSLQLRVTWHWFMAMDKPPFDDIRVRRAMNMSFDRQSFINMYLLGEGEIQAYPFNIEYPQFFTPLEELPESVQENYAYNPEMAKQLLDQAGYPADTETGDRFAVEVLMFPGTKWSEPTEIAIANWADVGVNVSMNILEGAAYVAERGKREYNMAFGPHGATPNWMARLFRDIPEGSQSLLDDPMFEQMKIDIQSELDPLERVRKTKESVEYWMKLAPSVDAPGAWEPTFWWPWLKNYNGEISLGVNDHGHVWPYIWIDQDLKKEMGY